MNPLEQRKQLLIAESEINRAQLIGELAVLQADVRTLTVQAQSLSSMTSAVAVLVAGLAGFPRTHPESTGVKPSWMQSILKGAGLLSNLWLAFRPRD